MFVSLSVAGCGSIPIVVPDLARRSSPPRLEGAHGPLSAAQSKAVLQRLAARGQEANVFDRHLAVEEAIVGSPLTTGNQVQLLQDGPATYRAMYAAIVDAKDHINMETYILDDDEVGQRFAKALVDKQRQGVQVNLIRDSVGTINTPEAFFEVLEEQGVQVLEFNPINPLVSRKEWELNQRDHRKLLIVDGHTAFLGGINISSVYSGGSFKSGSRPKRAAPPQPPAEVLEGFPQIDLTEPDLDTPWRDTDLKIQGPVVAEFQKLFLEVWHKQKGEPPPERDYFPKLDNVGKQVVRAIGSAPDDPYSQIYATLLSAIASAETSVYITNAYFVPDDQMLEALEDAARRGVDVTLILPGKTDSALVFHAGRSYYDRLLEAGVKIYERHSVILHAKTALIDGVWATVGSTNMDWRSFVHNYELNAVVLGADFGTQLRDMFVRDLAASDRVTLDTWRQRSIGTRLKEMFSRLWSYWL